MTTLFPLNHPTPTAFYLALYMLTLVLHVLFMCYVLAGTAWLAISPLFPRRNGATHVRDLLSEWMPFALSAAITAGVAPLLFVQILYKENFYTANLLLAHRWMAILPVLIAGFYLLYLLKSKLAQQRRGLRSLAALAASCCFAFTAWAWTENHLLSLSSAAWPSFYERGLWFFRSPELAPRLFLWAVAAIPVAALLVGWQLRLIVSRDHAPATRTMRRLSLTALTGSLLTVAAGAIYFYMLESAQQNAVRADDTVPYLVATLIGLMAQITAWSLQLRHDRPAPGVLILASLGVMTTLLAGAAVRETVRLTHIDVTALYTQHRAAFEVGGLWTFACFTLLNIVLISVCILIARKAVDHPVIDHTAD